MISFKDWAAAVFYQRLTQWVTWPIHNGILSQFKNNYPYPPGIRVLDIGCGTGYYSQLFLEANYTGLDLSYSRVRMARQNWSRPSVCQSAGSLGFLADTFDIVFCTNMIHHLEDSIFKNMLREMTRVVKKGGKIIIFDIYKQPGQSWSTRFAHWADRGDHIRQLPAIQRIFNDEMPGYKMTFFRNKILDFYNVLLIKP